MDSEFKRILSPSLALLVVAALTPENHDLVLEDENIETLDLDDSPDLVGMSVNVDTSSRAYEIADTYRHRGIPVVLGGIHASACPEEALVHADAVCIGEAEQVWPRILCDAAAGRLRGRYEAPAIFDPAKIPAPRWPLIRTERYLYTNIVCASRGCPFRCEFCYNSCAYRRHRYTPRSVDSVIEEIRSLGTRHVMFIDDNFIGDIRWTRDLVGAMKPLGLKWSAAVSTNIGQHPALLDDMAESGCQSLFIGFETTSRHALRSVQKHQNHVELYDDLIDGIHRRGIMINSSLVFGFDDHGPDVFADTLDWLVSHRIETMTAHILTPYPGTRLFDRFSRDGRITDTDWSHYNTAHVVFRPERMSPEELQRGYLWTYDRFYSLASILRRLPKNRKQWLPYLLFNLGYRKFGKWTSVFGRLTSMAAMGRLGRRLAYGLE